MCGYFCIGFIDFMLAGETLTEYKNLFSPNKRLILLKILIMMDIKEDLLLWYINFLIKSPQAVVLIYH